MESSTPNPSIFEKATVSAQFIRSCLPADLASPQIGIICGSGLGRLRDVLRTDLKHASVNYREIPHFPESNVHGHAGELVLGFLTNGQRPVILMVGRAHFYEGHSIQDTTFPVRVLKLLGIETLIVTNAAGGLNPTFKVGDFVLLSDHLNLAGLAGVHPLRGPNVDEFGTRFPPLSDAYDLDLRRQAHLIWKEVSLKLSSSTRKLHEGVYAFAGGPSYETRAECHMLKLLGADLVGMSTVPEVIVARHSALRVLAISLVTNIAVLEPGPRGDDSDFASVDASSLAVVYRQDIANHAEVLQAGADAAVDMQCLVHTLVSYLLSFGKYGTPD